MYKRKNKWFRVQLLLPKDLEKKVKDLAEYRGLEISTYLRMILLDYFANLNNGKKH
jgi:predicted DNA binding CopG/RHH family protein